MSILIYAAASVASFLASTFSGVLIYKHRERIFVALAVLRGRIKIGPNGISNCQREHVEPACVQVKKEDFEKLKKVASEHMVALGFIAAKDNKEYAKTVEQVMDGR